MATPEPSFPSKLSADLDQPPTYLDPSELGTKEYWDEHYAIDLNAYAHDDGLLVDPTDLETWFDDVDAPAKVLDFLTSATFPLSPDYIPQDAPPNSAPSEKPFSHASVLDLGTGNGSTLLTLRLQARYYGPMVGVDYSPQSIELARRLGREYSDPKNVALSDECEMPPAVYGCDKIRFEVFDVIRDDGRGAEWWPGAAKDSGDEGFDLVLDKGTFDAVSLSGETVSVTGTSAGNPETRIHTLYPARAIALVKPGGFLLLTSCNWTEVEVVRWFTTGPGVEGMLEVWGRIEYPVFEFGGMKGQGVASVCFRRKE